MASIVQTADKAGNPVYKIRVSNGRGRRVTRSWRPKPRWGKRTVQRELNKFAAQLEKDFANGEILTAAEKAERARAEARKRANRIPLRTYAQAVFLPMKRVASAQNTMLLYESMLNNHILPELGDIPLCEITAAMCTELLLDFQASGKGHCTCVVMHSLLRSIFACAVADETLPSSPMEHVKCPSRRKDELKKDDESLAFTTEELRRILSVLENETLQWRAYVTLLADSGARRGEICGLRWRDVDFTHLTISIHNNIQWSPGGYVETTTKTGSSRKVDIGTGTAALLYQLRAEQERSGEPEWCFTAKDRTSPLRPYTVGSYFQRFSKRCGVSDLHAHKFRHSSASAALAAGVSVKDVSARLGHANVKTTLSVYAHSSAEGIARAGAAARKQLTQL